MIGRRSVDSESDRSKNENSKKKIARVTSKGPFVCPPAQIALQRCAELSCEDKMPPKKRRNSGTITQFNSENQPSKKKVGTHTDGGDGSDNEWAPTQNKPTGFTSPKPAALHQPKSPKIYPIKNVFFRKGYNCIKNKNRWTQPASTTDPKKVEKSILIFAIFFDFCVRFLDVVQKCQMVIVRK